MATKKTSSKKTTSKSAARPVNLALQGGGAHGAFTWGVLDRLLEEESIDIEAITGTSAGAMNAAILAAGIIEGGREAAKDKLRNFWFKVSAAASMMPIQANMFEKMFGKNPLGFSPSFVAFDFFTRVFSPYQFNLFDLNPLRSIVDELVDFEAIRANKDIKLFVNATNVRTGKVRVFNTQELTLEMVMASACLPFIFKTVEVEGEPYWDGGYTGNPALYPLFYKCASSDIIIVQVNPLTIEEAPTHAAEILDRVNEISFNSSLMREVRAIEFVKRLLDGHKVSEHQYKDIKLHLIEAQELMLELGRGSKLNADWDFLQHLHLVGRQQADDWLQAHGDKVGRESSVDMEEVYL